MHACQELHVLWISCKINQCIWTAENFPLCADSIIGQDLGNLLSACDFWGWWTWIQCKKQETEKIIWGLSVLQNFLRILNSLWWRSPKSLWWFYGTESLLNDIKLPLRNSTSYTIVCDGLSVCLHRGVMGGLVITLAYLSFSHQQS